MSNYKYKEIVYKASDCKTATEKKRDLGVSPIWSYYFTKSILNPKKDITKIDIKNATKSVQDTISRQVYQKDYTDLAKRLVSYVEKNHQLPNYIDYKGIKLGHWIYTYLFARVQLFYYHNGHYPKYANVTSKTFVKPTETKGVVYDYYVQKTGIKPTTLDQVLTYVANNFKYEYYYDDHKTNKQVMDSKAGNCVDLLQWLWNMAKAMGYDCKCLHIQCQGGDGHVRGQFKHPVHTGGNWINRDPAAVASNGDIYSIWCSNGYLIDTNPDWFLENLNR